MTKTNILNLVYVLIIALLCFVINQRTAIYQCAAMFTGILVIANITLLHNRAHKAYGILLVGITLSLPLYALLGVYNSKIAMASIASLIIVSPLSIYITNILKNSYQFAVALFLSIILSAIIDGFIMSSYFSIFGVFTISKTINVLFNEILFKVLYTAIVSGIIYGVEFIAQFQTERR